MIVLFVSYNNNVFWFPLRRYVMDIAFTSHPVPDLKRACQFYEGVLGLQECQWFTAPYPADTIVEVRSLFSSDAMIEIEAIAVADSAAERE